ncbi:MAG: hypothetical protein AAGA16_07630 [Cyanobacteria bacterium P01_E01_bin.35]
MSEHEWAKIIYGRSYYLDFRFITVPHNFTAQDIQWASSYIVATTQRARNLVNSPRWSLFKNDDYCVVGVTCMVRDLINPSQSDSVNSMTKDDQGRPLYVFVGYVTELNQQRHIEHFPPYRATSLDDFQVLYQEIEKVWLVKNYEQNSRKTLLSPYQSVCFGKSAIALESYQAPTLNNLAKYPDQAYLWPSLEEQNSLLWLVSAQCSQATSICLNIAGKPLINSPFLNQSGSQIEQFQVKQRIATKTKHKATPFSNHIDQSPQHTSLSQKISNRAKEDIDLTLHQAAKVATASHELINSFTDWSNSIETDPQQSSSSSISEEAENFENFGFKTKKPSSSDKQDWF